MTDLQNEERGAVDIDAATIIAAQFTWPYRLFISAEELQDVLVAGDCVLESLGILVGELVSPEHRAHGMAGSHVAELTFGYSSAKAMGSEQRRVEGLDSVALLVHLGRLVRVILAVIITVVAIIIRWGAISASLRGLAGWCLAVVAGCGRRGVRGEDGTSTRQGAGRDVDWRGVAILESFQSRREIRREVHHAGRGVGERSFPGSCAPEINHFRLSLRCVGRSRWSVHRSLLGRLEQQLYTTFACPRRVAWVFAILEAVDSVADRAVLLSASHCARRGQISANVVDSFVDEFSESLGRGPTCRCGRHRRGL